ncbi:unnamed protein product [Adineta steineri]|uniref:VWA7 N-terminal domain-containing protein n=1 Tax=Adineta steineri TaxID=433720 RepID=A0A813W2K9_9BILA|nr:unnamed protein product [Adineta steineri]CAF0920182.1 unnamed protein product [Adineta steineri]
MCPSIHSFIIEFQLSMMVPKYILYLISLLFCLANIHAFIPHPLLAYGALTSNSITHTEITQLGFIRSLGRFFYDMRMNSNNTNSSAIEEDDFLTNEHTIDDLYEFAYPEYNTLEIEYYSLPLKFILDTILTNNVLVDFHSNTKKLSAAHCDSEAFSNCSRRVIQLKQKIVNNTRTKYNDFTETRELLGQLIHTVQDFYSHSNWVEMGKTDINTLMGYNETIGTVAAPDQATCTSSGCKKIEKTCTVWQQITLNMCPLVYYDCQNNILPEINEQQILTSGYLLNQYYENNDILSKPTNVSKCSHGSVSDASSHLPAIGGINKDAESLIYSPHSNLHKNAVDLAIKATERVFNDLRQDIGDYNFDLLFAISPNGPQVQNETDSFSQGKRFRFFTPGLATSVEEDYRLLRQLKKSFRKAYKFTKSIFTGRYFRDKTTNQPTYDLSDQGVNVKDINNFRSAPYLIGKEEVRRKKRMINVLRSRRHL